MEKEYASRCELQVMKVLWESKEDLDLAHTMEAVNKDTGNDWKPTTVSTFLARLRRKGYIKGTKIGRYVYYRPLVTREEWILERIAEDCNIANIPAESVIKEVSKELEKQKEKQ